MTAARTVVVLLSAGAALAPAASVSAKCARTEQHPAILTTRDTKLPDDGGILVGWQNDTYDNAATAEHVPYDKDPTDQPTWQAQDGAKKKIALTRTQLAPGLAVYKPAKGTGAVNLVDKKGKPLGAFTHDAKAAANKLPAPAVASLVLSVDNSERWSERHAIAKLSSPPPPEAMALVVSRDGVAISFVRLADTHDKLDKLDTFQDAGHCGSLVHGSEPPKAGDKVTFQWVDAFGRVSPASAPVTAR